MIIWIRRENPVVKSLPLPMVQSRKDSGSTPSTTPLSRPLKWTLGLTLASSAYALLWPTPTVVGVQIRTADASSGSGEFSIPRVSAATFATEVMPAPVFDTVERIDGSSTFDPFVGVVAAQVPTTPLAVIAPPVPAPPPMIYRFMGRMTAPDGTHQIFLTKGDNAVPIKVGKSLDDGYIVESIGPSNIVLSYPRLGVKVTIAIPAEGVGP
jgi:hypothetical protein